MEKGQAAEQALQSLHLCCKFYPWGCCIACRTICVAQVHLLCSTAPDCLRIRLSELQVLSAEVASYLGLELGKIKIKRFADGEIYVQVQVRHIAGHHCRAMAGVHQRLSFTSSSFNVLGSSMQARQAKLRHLDVKTHSGVLLLAHHFCALDSILLLSPAMHLYSSLLC
jgi:hypothetical protein